MRLTCFLFYSASRLSQDPRRRRAGVEPRRRCRALRRQHRARVYDGVRCREQHHRQPRHHRRVQRERLHAHQRHRQKDPGE